MSIIAAADGSALGNPGPAGWAWYVDDERWAAGGWSHGTNNIGELTAVLELLRATAQESEPVHILCDSQYAIKACTEWLPGWKRKGWRKADGKPVMNVELLKEIDAAIVGRTYRFEWVKGHANHPLNEAADARARAASEAFLRGRPVPEGPGFTREGDADAAAPVVAWTPVDDAPAVDAPSLFSFDDEPLEAAASRVTVTAELTPAQHERLVALAARTGVTVEQALAKLV